jgi:hypothetical protein
MSRADSYILKLNNLKSNQKMQIICATNNKKLLQDMVADINYSEAATATEKQNIESLLTLEQQLITNLTAIVW